MADIKEPNEEVKEATTVETETTTEEQPAEETVQNEEVAVEEGFTEEKAEDEKEETTEAKPKKKSGRGKKIAIAIAKVFLFLGILGGISYYVYDYAVKDGIPTYYYNVALEYMGNGDYRQAEAEFRALNGYKDSAEMADICASYLPQLDDYNYGVKLMSEGDYYQARYVLGSLDEYSELADYRDSCLSRIIADTYVNGVRLMTDGNYDEAKEVFESLDGYLDSEERILECDTLKTTVMLGSLEIGDTFVYGVNNEEPMTWRVLDISNNGKKILVITDDVIEYKQYGRYNYGESALAEKVTWGGSYARQWLKREFLSVSFTDYEQSHITSLRVATRRNPRYGTRTYGKTDDYVFLLSETQVKKYFPKKSDRVAFYQGVATSWWLRTPGKSMYRAMVVNADGSMDYAGKDAYRNECGIRPAMWLSIEPVYIVNQ